MTADYTYVLEPLAGAFGTVQMPAGLGCGIVPPSPSTAAYRHWPPIRQRQILFSPPEIPVCSSASTADSGGNRLLDSTLPTIWSLTIGPVEPNTLFAGTRPARLYRSRDGGRHWEKLAVDIARECSIGTPFVTSIIVDADDHRNIWAGVEIDGVFRSLDGGDSWMHLKAGLHDSDVHAVTIAPSQPRRVYVSMAREMFISEDLGDNWRPLGIKDKWPLPYARGKRATAPHNQSWRESGGPVAPGPAKRHDLGTCYPSRQQQPYCRIQPVRRGVRHRRCRHDMAQDFTGMRRDQDSGVVAEVRLQSPV